MIPKITILPEYISNRIAAGEIIERPSSVVRELLDNAIDAEADRIEIDIEQGGIALIRVTDNGLGFEPDGLLMAFERHATSKIKSLEDLEGIKTLGFRGEALPSIASVSRISIESQTQGAPIGSRLTINGGKIDHVEQAICPVGTKITVRQLFYNTPARRKFLKTFKTEYSLIHDTVIDHALTHPEIHFLLRDSGRVLLETPIVDFWSARIVSIFGKKFMAQHIPFQESHGDMHIQGVLCHPEHLRSTGRSQRIYVNGRRVRDRIVTQALYTGYAQFITSGGHPSCIVRIDIPPDQLDVNVHPAKSEVRFQNSNAVFNMVVSQVNNTLSGSIKTQFKANLQPEKDQERPSTGRATIYEKAPGKSVGVITPEKHDISSNILTFSDTNLETRMQLPLTADTEWNLIGQAFKTFILIEYGDRLFVIDQHTAHERILFELFKERYQSQNIPSQSLLFPVPVELELPQFQAIEEFSNLLRAMGVFLESFGRNTFAVTALPDHLAQEAPDLLLKNLADELLDVGSSERLRIAERKMLVSLACRKAVKAGDFMTRAEMESLVKDLIRCRIPNSCPHGRPIIVAFDRSEIAGKFKR
ncbi:MAG: DNA mismatch repair endonuclease MutL [bacterium]